MKYQKFALVYGLESEGKIVYVGVTINDVRQRISKHYQSAHLGYRGAKKLGPWLLTDPKFSIKPIEYCPVDDKFIREKYWIDFYDTINNGLNSEPFVDAPGRAKGCSNPSGKDHYMFGKPACKSAIKASVAARTGKKLSEEHRQKMREGHARRKLMKNK